MQATAKLAALRWKANAGSWSESAACETLLVLLERSGFAIDFTHVGKLTGKPQRLKSRKQLVDRLAREDVRLTIDGTSKRIAFVRDGNTELRVTASVSGETWGACSTWLIDFVQGLSSEFRDKLLIGPTTYVRPEIAISTLKPPRRHDFLEMQSCCDVLSAEALRQSPLFLGHPEYREEFEKQLKTLATDKLPRGARRARLNDDLVVLEWAPEDAREKQVRRAVENRQTWLSDHFHLEVEAGFNELGDALVYGFGLAERPHATFYGEGSAEAYKTAVARRGKLDRELLQEIRTWLRRAALPDRKPLKQLNLILPSRKAALDVRDQALAAGVTKVLYVDDGGAWWDPFPSDK